MHGQNEVANEFLSNESVLVTDMFPTVQGEGPDAGRPCVFLRLSQCNLRCVWCDTFFETGVDWLYEALNLKLFGMLRTHGYDLLVITGGEPLLQNLAPIVEFMNAHNIAVSVETSGSIGQPYLNDYFAPDRSIGGNLVVCSPKTPKISPHVAGIAGAFKYIIKDGETSPDDGLPVCSTQIEGQSSRLYRPQAAVPIFVQPCDEADEGRNKANLDAAVHSSMQYNHRLSIQLHKLAALP